MGQFLQEVVNAELLRVLDTGAVSSSALEAANKSQSKGVQVWGEGRREG